MESVRKRIQKIGKILMIVCTIARYVMCFSIAFTVVLVVGALFSDEVLKQAKSIFGQEEILHVISSFWAFQGMHAKKLVVVCGVIHVAIRCVFLAYLTFFRRFMCNMAEGSNPFTMRNAKKLRYASYTMFALVFYNFMMAVIMFLVMLFVSYLFEYGSYLRDKAEETNRIQEEMIVSFAEITENKSEQTGKHVRRVAEYSKILAEEMGFPEEKIGALYLASTMHDIGKLLIDTEILEKPARLTDEEYAEIKKHSGYGGKLLHSVEGDVMGMAETIALEHHERVDGKGYPEGKKGEEISLEGRIVAVADVYDALTSKRSYKEAWDDKRAYDEIVKGSGTQFDAKVVEAFMGAYERINQVRLQFADEGM